MRRCETRAYQVIQRLGEEKSSVVLSCRTILGAFLLTAMPVAQAASESLPGCALKYADSEIERLKCYDQLAAPELSGAALPSNGSVASGKAETGGADSAQTVAGEKSIIERSYLTRLWNLDDLSNLDPSRLGRLQPHRLNYLLLRKTNNPNNLPGSPPAGHKTLTPYDMDSSEAKFQLSLKADIGSQQQIDLLGIKTFRLWIAYTQQSNWQIFNARNSSPFRETNYEPELIATFGTGHTAGLKLINLGWVHQSNGRPLPESRSWNRLYLQGGWEWENNTSFMVRGWKRIAENPVNDDNPDIASHIGRAELVARWEPGDKSQAVAFLLRNNLGRKHNRSYVQIDWATPAKFGNAARVHVQVTSGYGESLIDYNHRQTTFGLGFSFREW